MKLERKGQTFSQTFISILSITFFTKDKWQTRDKINNTHIFQTEIFACHEWIKD